MQTALSPSTVAATQEQVDALVRELLPAQGQWTADAYLWLTDHTSRLIEFTDGYLEVLPRPTDAHQTIVLFLYELLVAFIRPRGGKVPVAPLRLQIRENKYREPGIVLPRSARGPRRQNRFWLGAEVSLLRAPRCRGILPVRSRYWRAERLAATGGNSRRNRTHARLGQPTPGHPLRARGGARYRYTDRTGSASRPMGNLWRNMGRNASAPSAWRRGSGCRGSNRKKLEHARNTTGSVWPTLHHCPRLWR